MSAPLRISVLDQSPIAQGSSGADALRNTLDLAGLADALGYHRYWVAEHHGGPMLAGPSPEVLIGPIAAATSGIRVGSGGVMLPHYSPLKVAESFSLLAGLYPGRIDLALGRAAGTDPLTTFALQRDRRQAAPDDFPAQLAELLAYLEDRHAARPPVRPPRGHASRSPVRPRAVAARDPLPQSALWAAELGLPYAFADFINPAGAPIAASYRERFVDSVRLASPHVAVAVWALCAEQREEAEYLAASSRWAMVKLRRGELIAVPPPDEALRNLEAAERSGLRTAHRRRAVLGTAAQVRDELEQIAARVRRPGADHRHDHARPRAAPPLLRAARGGLRARAAQPAGSGAAGVSAEHRVAIIGAGFSGLGAAIRLKAARIDDFVVLERDRRRRRNLEREHLPGVPVRRAVATCTATRLRPNPNWTRTFSHQRRDLGATCATASERYALRPHLRLGVEVRECVWQEQPRPLAARDQRRRVAARGRDRSDGGALGAVAAVAPGHRALRRAALSLGRLAPTTSTCAARASR